MFLYECKYTYFMELELIIRYFYIFYLKGWICHLWREGPNMKLVLEVLKITTTRALLCQCLLLFDTWRLIRLRWRNYFTNLQQKYWFSIRLLKHSYYELIKIRSDYQFKIQTNYPFHSRFHTFLHTHTHTIYLVCSWFAQINGGDRHKWEIFNVFFL